MDVILEDRCENCLIFTNISLLKNGKCLNCINRKTINIHQTKDGSRIIIFKHFIDKEIAKELFLECTPSVGTPSVGKEVNPIEYDFKWFGKSLKQKRLNWACGDKGVTHKFGGQDVKVNKWNSSFSIVRDHLIEKFDYKLIFCLVNYYRTGKDSIAQHSDGALGIDNAVFTLSMGATRKMKISSGKEKIDSKIFDFEEGDLLLMVGKQIQLNVKHGILEDKKILDARASLTFR